MKPLTAHIKPEGKLQLGLVAVFFKLNIGKDNFVELVIVSQKH